MMKIALLTFENPLKQFNFIMMVKNLKAFKNQNFEKLGANFIVANFQKTELVL